ncbi:hypothetical protein Barb7_01486 [Bacteroidales bacterium Barb7]|nr:hypothetical protein Barb7_01486 [Bacteroidales bacterium Barb7]
MDNLPPKSGSVNLLYLSRRIRINGILLCIGRTVDNRIHKLIINLDGHICPRHLSLRHLRINKRFRIGMLHGHTQHQSPAPPVLRHLARGIGITLHERNQPCGSKCRVLHRRPFGTDMGKVVPHTAAPLHQLHLLFVNADNGTVGIRPAVQSNHKAVRERSNLKVIPDTRHRASLWHDIPEMIKQIKQLIFGKRIGILLLDAGNLLRQPSVHVRRRFLINVAESIL